MTEAFAFFVFLIEFLEKMPFIHENDTFCSHIVYSSHHFLIFP